MNKLSKLQAVCVTLLILAFFTPSAQTTTTNTTVRQTHQAFQRTGISPGHCARSIFKWGEDISHRTTTTPVLPPLFVAVGSRQKVATTTPRNIIVTRDDMQFTFTQTQESIADESSNVVHGNNRYTIPNYSDQEDTVWGLEQTHDVVTTYTVEFFTPNTTTPELLYDFCFTIYDIDGEELSDAASDPDYDHVTVNGYDRDDNIITLSASNIRRFIAPDQTHLLPTSSFAFASGASVVFTGDDTAAPSPSPEATSDRGIGSVMICFPQPIKKLEITYDTRNGNGWTDDMDAGGNPLFRGITPINPQMTGSKEIAIGDFNYCSKDFDRDGIRDNLDNDADGDGIPNDEEGYSTPGADVDMDGIPDVYDSDAIGWMDSNGDGVDDRYDFDNDKKPNSLDLDWDGDGVPDSIEYAYDNVDHNSDTDLIPDYRDLDSDNDGISDVIERQLYSTSSYTPYIPSGFDFDGDGIDYELDRTTDFLTMPSINGINFIVSDADMDGILDIYDTDSDNDTVEDLIEGDDDVQPYKVRDTAVPMMTDDTNGDGFYDFFETNPPTLQDHDGDDIPDWRDNNDDGDNILTVEETGDLTDDYGILTYDYNIVPPIIGDGIPDYRQTNRHYCSFGEVNGFAYAAITTSVTATPPPIPAGTTTTAINPNLALDKPNIIPIEDIPVGSIPTLSDYMAIAATINQTTNSVLVLDFENDAYIPTEPLITNQVGDGLETRDEVTIYAMSDGITVVRITGKYRYNNGSSNISVRFSDATGAGTADTITLIDSFQAGVGVQAIKYRFPRVNTIRDAALNISASLTYVASDASFHGIRIQVIGGTGTLYVDGIEYIHRNPSDPIPCLPEFDGDFIPDIRDFDADNDGLTKEQEGVAGNDLDLDSDNDGLSDTIEGNGGVLPTGIPFGQVSYRSSYVLQNDLPINNGYRDGYIDNLSLPNTNTDSLDEVNLSLGVLPDARDLDSDNDGVPDLIENGRFDLDQNRDGILDMLADMDNDGLANEVDPDQMGALTVVNSDGVPAGDHIDDTVPNYIDMDSDGDGLPDLHEAHDLDLHIHESNYMLGVDFTPQLTTSKFYTGRPKWDTNSGISVDDLNMADLSILTQAEIALMFPSPELETADDNIVDQDGDGLIDAFDPVVPGGTAGTFASLPNTNEEGHRAVFRDLIPNYLDTDDDGDGIPTMQEDASDGNFYNDFSGGQRDYPVGDSKRNYYRNIPDYLFSIVSPLPVELISFNVSSQNGNYALLEWATAQEINNDRFEIKYSSDGINFSKIGRVNGNGNVNTVSDYSFVHTKPKEGLNYYQLKQVDYDGAFDYSEIKLLKLGKLLEDVSVYIYPNPTTETHTVSVRIRNGIATRVEFISLVGAVVKSYQFEEGMIEHTFDVSDQEAGMYIMKVSGPSFELSNNVIVR